MVRFLSGKGSGSTPVTISRGGAPLRGTLEFEPGAVSMFGVPKANNPADVERAVESFDQLVEGIGDDTFTLTFKHAFEPRRARLGWLRAAYLIAFAQFGYRYILRPAFEPLRAQLMSPDEAVLDPPPVTIDPSAVGEHGGRLLMPSTDVLDIVIVDMGWVYAFLPGADGSAGFFDTVIERVLALSQSRRQEAGIVGLDLPGGTLEWPTSPQYVFDR
jgi:hypothetical protein